MKITQGNSILIPAQLGILTVLCRSLANSRADLDYNVKLQAAQTRNVPGCTKYTQIWTQFVFSAAAGVGYLYGIEIGALAGFISDQSSACLLVPSGSWEH